MNINTYPAEALELQEEGQYIGSIKLIFTPSYIYLESLYISPSHRDKGHGTYLLQYVLDTYEAPFRLRPNPYDNPSYMTKDRLIYWYEKRGFIRDGSYMVYTNKPEI
jgi:GNAT superfamily N-acetyltransferase